MTLFFAIVAGALAGILVTSLMRTAGQLVVVTTKQGDSFRGQRRPTLRLVVVLAKAEELGSGLRLPGRVEIPRENVGLIQRLPTEEPQPYAGPTEAVPIRRTIS